MVFLRRCPCFVLLVLACILFLFLDGILGFLLLCQRIFVNLRSRFCLFFRLLVLALLFLLVVFLLVLVCRVSVLELFFLCCLLFRHGVLVLVSFFFFFFLFLLSFSIYCEISVFACWQYCSLHIYFFVPGFFVAY